MEPLWNGTSDDLAVVLQKVIHSLRGQLTGVELTGTKYLEHDQRRTRVGSETNELNGN